MFDVRPTENLEDFQRAFLAIGQYFGAEPTPERAEKFSQSLPFERMHAHARTARSSGAPASSRSRCRFRAGSSAAPVSPSSASTRRIVAAASSAR